MLAMRPIHFLLSALAAICALNGPVRAQVPRDTVSIDLTNLQEILIVDGARQGDAKGDEETYVSVEPDSYWTANLAPLCDNSKSGGKAAINYKRSSGASSHSADCNAGDNQYAWHFAYQWNTTTTLAGNRLALNGKGSVVKDTLRGCRSCGTEVREIVEQATIRLSAAGCTIESFNRKTTITSPSPAGGNTVLVYVLTATPKSRCSYLR